MVHTAWLSEAETDSARMFMEATISRLFIYWLVLIAALLPGSAASETVRTTIPIIDSESLGLNGSNRAIYDLGGIPSDVDEGQMKIGLVRGLAQFGLSPDDGTISKFGLIPPLGVTWTTDYSPLSDEIIKDYNKNNKTKQLDIRRSWAVKVDILFLPQAQEAIFATKIDVYQGFNLGRLELYSGEYNSFYFHEMIKKDILDAIK